jgi:glucose/mannose-6-phosphate isomerase
MTALDQPATFRTVDPSDALGVTAGSAEQWVARHHVPGGLTDGVDAVLVVGMGASGIAGDLVAAVAADRLPVPTVVHKDAELPAFVGPRTLVLAVSYSGETEETVTAAGHAIETGARVVAVTSGGALAARVREAGRPVVTVPGGHQPRHAIAWLAGALLACCGLDDAVAEAAAAQRLAASACAPTVPTVKNPAKRLATTAAASGLVVVWGTSRISGVLAQRFASQLNEHAKLPAYRSSLPELAHNEVVGWEGYDEWAPTRGLVVVRDPDGETAAARSRVVPVLDQVRHRFGWIEQFSTPAGPALVRFAALSMLLDLASVYTAIARNVDPTPIRSIDALKAALAGNWERSGT